MSKSQVLQRIRFGVICNLVCNLVAKIWAFSSWALIQTAVSGRSTSIQIKDASHNIQNVMGHLVTVAYMQPQSMGPRFRKKHSENYFKAFSRPKKAGAKLRVGPELEVSASLANHQRKD